MFELLDFMPEGATRWAENVDFVNNLITYLSVFFTVAITGAAILFGIIYRRTETNTRGANITHSATLETLWTAIPSVVCVALFIYGFLIYKDMRTPPANATEVFVEGYRWAWDFRYPNGKKSTNELVVPVNEPIRLVMKSKDVNHSFFIPAMRVKEDVITSQYNYLWFEANKTGTFRIFCAEYCGTDHSGMLGSLKVVSQEEYQDYLLERGAEDLTKLPPAKRGEKIYSQKCIACHSLDGSKKVGPTFKGLFGAERKFTDGGTAVADENYLRSSIMEPTSQIVEGYPPAMVPQGLDDAEVDAMIAFIKEQK